MHDVWQHCAVHLFVFRPIRAMHVRHVEIVALIAPAFVENLFELFFGIEIHPQSKANAAGIRLRRSSIRIDDEERRNRRASTESRAATTTAAPSRGTINKLA